MKRIGPARAMSLLALLLLAGTEALAAQAADSASGVRRVTLEFAPGNATTEGYDGARVTIEYRMAVCGGDLVLAHRLDGASIEVSDGYWRGGRRFQLPKGVVPTRPTSVSFAGVVLRNGVPLAPFATTSGNALSFDCFSGDYVSLGAVRRLFPAPLSASERANLRASFSLQVAPAPPRRDAVGQEIAEAIMGCERRIGRGIRAREVPPKQCNDPTAGGELMRNYDGVRVTFRVARLPSGREVVLMRAHNLRRDRAAVLRVTSKGDPTGHTVLLNPNEVLTRTVGSVEDFQIDVQLRAPEDRSPAVIDVLKGMIREQLQKDAGKVTGGRPHAIGVRG